MREDKVTGGEPIDTEGSPPGTNTLQPSPKTASAGFLAAMLRKLDLPHPREWLRTPDPNTTPDPGAKDRLGESYLALRQCLGFVGVLFPLLLIAFSLWDGEEQQLRTSISAYYYSAMRDVFVGALVAIGLLLITYCGNYRWENVLSTVSGIGAIGVALLPTQRQCNSLADPIWFAETCEQYVIDKINVAQPDYFLWFSTEQYPVKSEGLLTISNLHYLSAAAFLLGVAALAYWAFAWTSDTNVRDADKKSARNWFYRRCAVVIVACVALIGIDGLLTWLEILDLKAYEPVFWLEAIALWAFAAAWLVKGNVGDRIHERYGRFFPSDGPLKRPAV